MNRQELESVASALVSKGKGILAADESFSTIKKRLQSVDLDSTEETRRSYRDLLFTTPGIEEFISGVILFDETIRQEAKNGTPFPKLLAQKGIMPGIKVDKGAKDLAGFPEGIERCEEVTEATLKSVFAELLEHRVALEGMLLKPNMVISGKECPRQAGVAEVAEATVRCLRRTVPAAVPGIVFLSGGQSPEQATEHLNAMNALGTHPWELSFSYGRALQEPTLKTWKGKAANVPAAQKIFHHRAKCNSAARSGQYSKQMEAAAA